MPADSFAATSADPVLLEIVDRIAIVTLNRPDARNALSSEVLRILPERLAEAEANDDVDVIILTGADPAFCAGLDLKELGSSGSNLAGSSSRSVSGLVSGSGAEPVAGTVPATGSGTGVRTSSAEAKEAQRRGPFPPLTKPLIGAINGVAITGGFELALSCDFLIASEHAKFGDTHSRVGVMPGWGLTVLLPQAIGVRRAREMSFTGNFMLAEEALAFGLVNHVVAHDELMPFTRQLAADICGNEQDGVRQIRSTYDAVATDPEQWATEARDGKAWRRAKFSPEQVEARRQAIQARGQQQ